MIPECGGRMPLCHTKKRGCAPLTYILSHTPHFLVSHLRWHACLWLWNEHNKILDSGIWTHMQSIWRVWLKRNFLTTVQECVPCRDYNLCWTIQVTNVHIVQALQFQRIPPIICISETYHMMMAHQGKNILWLWEMLLKWKTCSSVMIAKNDNGEGFLSCKTIAICLVYTVLALMYWVYCDNKKKKKTPWSESASKLYRPSDRSFSAKWLPTFVDKGCQVVSVTDPYGRILGFLDRSRYFSIK
jgi:hypothetical protein